MFLYDGYYKKEFWPKFGKFRPESEAIQIGRFLFLREDLVSEHEPLAKFIDDNRLLT